jgi:hypothetical protein
MHGCSQQDHQKDNCKQSEKLNLAAEQVQCQPWNSKAIMQLMEVTAP